ncbi:MAG: hypothetical protein GY940_19345 [bacterium]|nr:hypothetical protein [bacterium]
MKEKKYARKLVLKKTSIADLNTKEMASAHGGIGRYTGVSCATEGTRCTIPQCCYDTFYCTDPLLGVCQGGTIPTVPILCG